jgi:intraflagellar transport protein 20
MANEVLAKSGLFFDELNKIRVVNPQAAQNCNELQQECTEFVSSKCHMQHRIF